MLLSALSVVRFSGSHFNKLSTPYELRVFFCLLIMKFSLVSSQFLFVFFPPIHQKIFPTRYCIMSLAGCTLSCQGCSESGAAGLATLGMTQYICQSITVHHTHPLGQFSVVHWHDFRGEGKSENPEEPRMGMKRMCETPDSNLSLGLEHCYLMHKIYCPY